MSAFGSFQTIRLIHFLCMTAIVAFILVHVTLALLVPRSLLAMTTGAPLLDASPAAAHPVIPKNEPIAEIEAPPEIPRRGGTGTTLPRPQTGFAAAGLPQGRLHLFCREVLISC
jgi:hypothetical protein